MAVATLGLGGCVSFVARQIEYPGHSKKSASPHWLLDEAGFRNETMRTTQGVRIAYWYGQPRDYGLMVDYSERRTGKRVSYGAGFRFNALEKATPLPVRGSVVLLHPWSMDGSAMGLWGMSFAGAGYQVVMPDLRSQGRSGDAPVGYGPREAGDIVELVHQLEAAHRLPAPVYLLGISYGATVALFAAPQLPEVRGVVALEPYANAADVIRRAPASNLFGHRWLARWISPRDMDKAIARADRKLGVDLAKIDPGAALAQTQACTLVLGGSKDELIPSSAMRELAQHSPRARYVEIDGEGHLNLPVRVDRLFPPLLKWIDALPGSAGDACPGYAPLPRDSGPASDAKKVGEEK